MEFNFKSGINEHSETYVKESRKTRHGKLEQKKYFHRKNPKSIAYYANKNIEQNNELNQQLKESEKNNMLNELEQEQNINEEKISKHKERQKSLVRIRQKTLIIGGSLSKNLKKDGVFILANNDYSKLEIMKDFHVKIDLNNKHVALNLRLTIDRIDNFEDIVLEHDAQYGKIKDEVNQRIRNKIETTNVREYVETKLNKILEKALNSDAKEFVPTLEKKLIESLKKSAKQSRGFDDKVNVIYSQWCEQTQEILHISKAQNALKFESYEDCFPVARELKRKFLIYIGPTNSGKTYEAMNQLAKGATGVYLAPLRLMAQEGQESLFERGVLANLLTGEEQQLIPGATHTSSTVEMCNMGKRVDVAVIDEIQMIGDESRGWAWSAALVGVPAKTVVLVGSEDSLPYIEPVLKNLGESYEIKRFQRKSPLLVREPLAKIKNLKEGDCVVTFSRKAALEMKNDIESYGKKCSVIYGNLSPDVRRIEAQKFKNGENQILVATDAIGMGLNLPIHRLFFSTIEKFDGNQHRCLTTSEIKQISGRAGRYGIAEKGEVGLLFAEDWSSQGLLQKAIIGGYDYPDDTRIAIAPNLQHIQSICDIINKKDLYSALLFFREKMVKGHSIYKASNLETMIEIAGMIKNKKLDLQTGLNYACVPIDSGSDFHSNHFFGWLNNHIAGRENKSPKLPDSVSFNKLDSASLYEAENYVKLCMAYRWLHYKYPDVYNDLDTVIKNCQKTNKYIETTLHKQIVMTKLVSKWKRR